MNVESETTDVALVSMRVVATAEIKRLRVEHLGVVIVDSPQPSGLMEISRQLSDIHFPAEGVDFWIEADLENVGETGGDATAPAALRLELEDSDGELYRHTLWTDGGSAIADSVFFAPLDEGGDFE